jgi:hypothetical protein
MPLPSRAGNSCSSRDNGVAGLARIEVPIGGIHPEIRHFRKKKFAAKITLPIEDTKYL